MTEDDGKKRRSVPWPQDRKPSGEPGPIYAQYDDGKRDVQVLAADIKNHIFFGGAFMIGREAVISGLKPGVVHRISIGKDRKLFIDRVEHELPEALIYRIKAHLFKVQKEKKDAERKEQQRRKDLQSSRRKSQADSD